MVGDLEDEVDSKGGALRSAGRRNGQRSDVGGGVRVDLAELDLLAHIDGIRVNLLERLDERLNANNLAENVAHLGFQTVRQLAALHSTHKR